MARDSWEQEDEQRRLDEERRKDERRSKEYNLEGRKKVFYDKRGWMSGMTKKEIDSYFKIGGC